MKKILLFGLLALISLQLAAQKPVRDEEYFRKKLHAHAKSGHYPLEEFIPETTYDASYCYYDLYEYLGLMIKIETSKYANIVNSKEPGTPMLKFQLTDKGRLCLVPEEMLNAHEQRVMKEKRGPFPYFMWEDDIEHLVDYYAEGDEIYIGIFDNEAFWLRYVGGPAGPAIPDR